MINSIPKIESNSDNTFGKITSKKNPSDYWIASQPDVNQSNKQSSQTEVQSQDSVKLENSEEKYLAASPYIENFKIITPEEARKTNNIKIIGLSIAGATVLTAGTIFLLLKGGPKSIGKNINKLRGFLEKKVQEAKLDGNDVLSTTNKVYVYALDRLNKLQERSGFVNNYNTVKDLLFKRIMGCNKYLAKVHDKITTMFERIGRQAVVNTYKKTNGLLKNALGTASEATANPATKRVKELVLQANELNKEIGLSNEKYFGETALRTRYFTIKSAVESLKQSFSKMKVFLSKDVYSKFMADSKIVEKRESLIRNVIKQRRELSFPISALVKDSDEALMKMVNSLSFKDTDRITQIRNLRAQIKQFGKCKNPLARQELTVKLTQDMDAFISGIKDELANKTITEKAGNELLASMSELKANIIGYKPGKVDEVLSIYRQILPNAEYRKVEKQYRAWLKSLDKSIKTETEDFMGKLRDLAMGSAPTDILTILGSFGILGYNLAKSKDNDQRTSIALKYGIPALAGIGGSLYFNAKLFAGTKALLSASLLSLAVNRLGTWADNSLKKYKQSKTENPPKTV